MDMRNFNLHDRRRRGQHVIAIITITAAHAHPHVHIYLHAYIHTYIQPIGSWSNSTMLSDCERCDGALARRKTQGTPQGTRMHRNPNNQMQVIPRTPPKLILVKGPTSHSLKSESSHMSRRSNREKSTGLSPATRTYPAQPVHLQHSK